MHMSTSTNNRPKDTAQKRWVRLGWLSFSRGFFFPPPFCCLEFLFLSEKDVFVYIYIYISLKILLVEHESVSS